MTGADAPALRALAGQMSQSAVQLDRMRQTIRARVYAINWQGLDGVDFRRAWDAQHGPMLTRVAEGLRSTAQHLLREADQQEKASGAVGGSALRGLVPGALGEGGRATGVDLNALQRLLNIAGASPKFVELVLDNYRDQVGKYLDDAKWVERYNRWADEYLGPLGRRLSNVDDLADDVGKVGKFLPVLGGLLDGVGQWQEDEKATREDGAAFRPGEQQARAVVGGGVMAGLDLLLDATLVPALAGAGFVVAGGPVGAVGGGMLGYVLSTGISMALEDPLTDAAAWSVSRVYDVGEFMYDGSQAVVDYGGRVLDAGGDLLDAGGRIADDAGEAVGDFLHAVNPWGRP